MTTNSQDEENLQRLGMRLWDSAICGEHLWRTSVGPKVFLPQIKVATVLAGSELEGHFTREVVSWRTTETDEHKSGMITFLFLIV